PERAGRQGRRHQRRRAVPQKIASMHETWVPQARLLNGHVVDNTAQVRAGSKYAQRRLLFHGRTHGSAPTALRSRTWIRLNVVTSRCTWIRLNVVTSR